MKKIIIIILIIISCNLSLLYSKDSITLQSYDKYDKNGEIILANLGDKNGKYNYFIFSDLNKISSTFALIDKTSYTFSSNMTAKLVQSDLKNNNFYFLIFDPKSNANIADIRYDIASNKAVLEDYSNNESQGQIMDDLDNFISFSISNNSITLTKKRNFELIKSLMFYNTKGEIIYSTDEDFNYQLKIDINNISSGMYFFRIITVNSIYIKKFPIIN